MKKKSPLSGGWAVIVPLTTAIFAYLWFVFFPQMSEIRRMREEIAEKQTFIAGAAQRTAREKEIDDQQSATRAYVERYRGATGKPSDVAGLFATLSELLKQADVTTTMFRPETKQPFAAIERIPVTIGCTGDHERLLALLAKVERVNQRIWIDEVSLERGKEDGEGMTCRLKPVIFVNNFEISD